MKVTPKLKQDIPDEKIIRRNIGGDNCDFTNSSKNPKNSYTLKEFEGILKTQNYHY